MSRTDKDRPYRLREYEDGYIDHDHRFDVCRVETREQALTSTWRRGHQHYRVCKKYEIVSEPCKGALLITARFAERTRWGSIRHYRKDTCSAALEDLAFLWELYNDPSSVEDEKSMRRKMARYFAGKRHFCVREHTTRVFHAEWPCTCDNDPLPATCDYTLSHEYGGWRHGGVPTAFVNQFHRANRRHVDAELYDARRAYNAGEDIEPAVYDKFHPSCAAWYWW